MLNSLLRNVASGLRGETADPGWEYCHTGYSMCARCLVGRNRRKCPLDDDTLLDKWAAMHTGQIWADPELWADKAREQIEQFENPAMMIFFQAVFDLSPLEGPEMDFWRSRLDQILASWTDKGWLARFAEQAREREARDPTDTTLTDIAETVDTIMALTDSATCKVGQHND